MFSAGVGSRFSKLLESESVFKTAVVGVGSRFFKTAGVGVGSRNICCNYRLQCLLNNFNYNINCLANMITGYW